MLDLRIYRAAFVVVALALVVVAFSLHSQQRGLQTTLPPDAFDAGQAMAILDGSTGQPGLAARFESRRPGSKADFALADVIARGLARPSGPAAFQVSRHDFQARTIDGERTLRTVIATRPGTVSRQIVLVAHRDAAARGSRAELSGTAALLELAHVFAGRRTRRTLTLVSTSGGSGGAAGAADAAGRLDGPVDAVIVLGDLAASATRKPWIVPWSEGVGAASVRLRKTVDIALRDETGQGAGAPRATAQLLRFAFPLTVSEQGVFAAHGMPAVQVGPGGELGARSPDAPVSLARMESFGRAVLRSVTALDAGPNIRPSSPRGDIVLKNQVVPAWAIRLLVGSLLVPPLLAVVDGVFRVRRRREQPARWFLWALAGALPFLLLWGVAVLMRLTGLIDAPPQPAPPAAVAVRPAALVAAGVVLAIGWLLVRLVAVRRVGTAGPPGTAGSAAGVGLLTCIATAAVWIANPFAAAFLVLAAHLWVLAVAPEVRVARRGGLVMVTIGLVPLAVAVLAYGFSLHAGPVRLAWMGLLLLAGGHVGILSGVIWSVVAACACGALVVVARRRAEPSDPSTVRSRGPLTYAGPGSLGGTDSALRR